ncbi:MAG: MauE/DoxX family redox-associated membrane protein [Planctomycetota bacterium]
MQKSLFFQMLLLLMLSVVLAFVNNFRSAVSLDWLQYWTPMSELKNNNQVDLELEEINEWEELDATMLPNEIEMFLRYNEGKSSTLIGSKKAAKIHEYAFDKILWIDARSPELYEEGHIQGATLLHFYEKPKYLPEVQQKIQENQPISLLIYCRGKECTDSKLLAEDFERLGYRNIFIYSGGYDQWKREGYPTEGNPKNTANSTTNSSEKPPGMYLEHLVLDLIPCAFGILFVLGWKKMKTNMGLWIASLFVGLFFLYASVPKVLNPLIFAKNIWNYDLIPGQWINGMALILPILEVIAGLCLMTDFFRKGSSGTISLLLIVYMIAVSTNMIRGHEFQCGCFTETTWITPLYLEGWNDKITLLLRDIALLILSLFTFFYPSKKSLLQE